MGHSIVSKLAMLGDLCSRSLNFVGLIRLYVYMFICFWFFCFMLLCYFDQTIYCLFLLPSSSSLTVWIDLETRFKSPLKDFLKDIGIHTRMVRQYCD